MDDPMRFIEKAHKSERVENILLHNPLAFFCLISKEDLKNDVPLDGTHFSKLLVKNNILKKKIDSKLSTSIKSTCFLVFPKEKGGPLTPGFVKWFDNPGINLLFVKCGSRYYSSLVSSIMDRKGIGNLIIIIRTLTGMLGKLNTLIDRTNGAIYKLSKKLSSYK
jgi:hypothetical protein